MWVVLKSRLGVLLGYLAFTATLVWGAVSLGSDALTQGVTLMPELVAAEPVEPSRVEQFLLDKIAASEAPQVPVPRVITASVAPAMPVPVLAAQLDAAESLPVAYSAKLRRLYDKARARAAQNNTKQKTVKVAKQRRKQPGALPGNVIAQDSFGLGLPVATKPAAIKSKRPRVAESARDITYRSLGAVAFATK